MAVTSNYLFKGPIWFVVMWCVQVQLHGEVCVHTCRVSTADYSASGRRAEQRANRNDWSGIVRVGCKPWLERYASMWKGRESFNAS